MIGLTSGQEPRRMKGVKTMRVTKTIREYIQETVGDYYNPLITELREKDEEVLELVREKMNEICDKATAEGLVLLKQYPGISWQWHKAPFSFNYPSLAIKRETQKAIDALVSEMEKTIRDITVTLELGGSKSDLD